MLCAICMSMFQRSATCGAHHQTSENLDAAATNGCRICYYLRKEIILENWSPLNYEFSYGNALGFHGEIEFYRDNGKDAKTGDRGEHHIIFLQVAKSTNIPLGYDDFLELVNNDLALDPPKVRKGFPRLRDIPDNSGHSHVLQLAKRWLEKCRNHHDCQSKSGQEQIPGWYPKRLIHVGGESQSPRLIVPEQHDLDGSYAALSHCWGESPDFLMLTSETLSELQKEIEFHKLPASFRDAITTCREMQIPYLWIDSLCILQKGPGSHEDWLFHSEEMHRVYKHCQLNISIDDSSNPHGGAFRSRDPLYLQDCYLWTHFALFPKPKFESPLTGDFSPHWTDDFPPLWNETSLSDIDSPINRAARRNLCAIYTPDDFSWRRLHLPLNQRAWVFQERLLSPRTLHFSWDRITWECGKITNATEYLPEGIFDDVTNDFDCLYREEYNIESSIMSTCRYFDLVFQYADRQLSHPNEDKLVAFAAVARYCSSSLGPEYCAGIFRSTLPTALVWQASWGGSVRRPDVYRAPSWSWASLDTRIYFRLLYEDSVILAEVKDISVDLVDPGNVFGQVKSASLSLTGPMIASTSISPDDPGLLGLSLELPASTDSLPDSDKEKKETISQDGIFFFAILEASKHQDGALTLGIILQIDPNGDYHRIGLWEAEAGFVSQKANGNTSFQTETVRIL